jgi:predicted RNase H-like HicB family nuclease
MHWTLEIEQEVDGRWLAEVPEIPGALAYGETRAAAMAKAEALALRALAEQLEAGEAAL